MEAQHWLRHHKVACLTVLPPVIIVLYLQGMIQLYAMLLQLPISPPQRGVHLIQTLQVLARVSIILSVEFLHLSLATVNAGRQATHQLVFLPLAFLPTLSHRKVS